MTTVEPPERNDEAQERRPTDEELEGARENELAEERRVHRERREGTMQDATDEQRQRAEELRKQANPSQEKETSDENEASQRLTE